LDEAEESFLAARRVRPWLWNTHYHLALLYRDRGEYERAFAAAEAIDPRALRDRAFLQSYLLGIIRLDEAIERRGKGDAEPALALAAEAVEHFDRALAAEPGGWTSRVQANRIVADAIGANDLSRACAYYLVAAAADPQNRARLANLQTILPEDGLDATATQALGIYLDRLRRSLAPAAIDTSSSSR
jgi:tetratricopeptide (TPR) repeat protein